VRCLHLSQIAYVSRTRHRDCGSILAGDS
jgi:hypothetical protein